MAMSNNPDNTTRDRNEDAITGEPGSHPVGAGLGAAAGGAAAGAAAGTIAGPIGTVVGAVVGGVAGGYAGKAVAEHIDPTAEDAYWRNEYRHRDYYDESVPYDDVQPAYRHGWESRTRYGDRPWDAAEADVRRDWENSQHGKSMNWERVKRPARDAWDRVERALPGDADRDGR
jgi:hypothetical protein